MKKLIALLLCCTCIALSGCSVEVGDTRDKDEISSFDGIWRQASKHEAGIYMEAEITGDTIIIDMIYDNGRSSGVYWYGTMPTLNKTVSSYEWVSTGDKTKIHLAFADESESQKHFMYMDGYILFPYTIPGQSIIMRLERVDE